MFGKKDPVAPATMKSLIAQGTRIHGDMRFGEGLRVDGEVYGAIHANTEGGTLLVISEGALVDGGVEADHVIINGTVKGAVVAREQLELQPKARIEGDVHYAALAMQHGAIIAGQLRPLGSAAASSDEGQPLAKLSARSA